MSFISTEFLGLLAVVLAVYWWLPHRLQNLFLVVVSFVFYGWLTPWYPVLLLYSVALDFSCGLALERWPKRTTAIVATSVAGNFLLLGAFKYFDFFVDNVAAALTALGIPHDVHALGIVLPIGISFYTFQTLSYTVDVSRKRLKACRDPLDFLLFVSFFPQLVAGPIGRSKDLFPQISRPRSIDGERVRSGIGLALWGAFKKVVIADTMRIFIAPLFAHDQPSWAMVWSAALAANVMMFADFSGYTDIARGTARLLGFELARNFDAPFLSRTPNEWWTRWHISFYDWVRDYVFQPLVLHPFWRRNGVLPMRKPTQHDHMVRGIVGSMLFSGIWHGAAWHYAAWGVFFSVIQLGYYATGRLVPKPVAQWKHRAWVQTPVMVVVMAISAVLFQEPDLRRTLSWFFLNPIAGTPSQWLAVMVVWAATLAGGGLMTAQWWVMRRYGDRLAQHPVRLPLETTAWCLAVWAVLIFVKPGGSDFEYFRF
ncbi:MAG: MBOAT family protein [Alphaproteobacteria bacterium]|nr:MBOAT family protein [Alphaproteobacteria bacterium]MCB9696241.1 MBOAT family protein [Alphaproteobacteria bacterium]